MYRITTNERLRFTRNTSSDLSVFRTRWLIQTYCGYISGTDRFDDDGAAGGSTCFAENAYVSTRIVGAPTVHRVCNADSAFYSDLSFSWVPEVDFYATIGFTNITDEQPAQVSSGLGNDRAGRMVGTGYDQVGRTAFVNLGYKF